MSFTLGNIHELSGRLEYRLSYHLTVSIMSIRIAWKFTSLTSRSTKRNVSRSFATFRVNIVVLNVPDNNKHITTSAIGLFHQLARGRAASSLYVPALNRLVNTVDSRKPSSMSVEFGYNLSSSGISSRILEE